MAIFFETVARDIAGRTGKLRVGDKIMRTPALLPVINPHIQLIPPRDMRKMGVEALITNAYIFHRSHEYRERALMDGLHKTLDFDGIIMTDSGSFQLSVYGDVEITNRETLEFQKKIGSDIWVPLDIPTHPDADRETTARELAITMERLKEATLLMGEDHQLAGPVQGGMYEDMREKTGREVGELGYSFCPIGAVVPLMESYRFRDLVRVVLAAKKGIPASACVHLFGAGHPVMFALAVAMGCDIFDSAAYALYAKEGRYMTSSGSYKVKELVELPCACEVCRNMTAEELNASPDKERLLSMHNLSVSLAEISRIRQAIYDGVLWELVDERCRSHPELLKGYRELIRHAELLEQSDRVSKRRFFYRGTESCNRTEVTRYRNMIPRLPSGKKVQISLDGGTREGYDRVLFFKPPFGPYPAELKETFPIGQSELPDWDDEMVRAGCTGIVAYMESNPGTDVTIFCTREWYDLVRQTVPQAEVKCDDI